jgi:hypothetical protein
MGLSKGDDVTGEKHERMWISSRKLVDSRGDRRKSQKENKEKEMGVSLMSIF